MFIAEAQHDAFIKISDGHIIFLKSSIVTIIEYVACVILLGGHICLDRILITTAKHFITQLYNVLTKSKFVLASDLLAN